MLRSRALLKWAAFAGLVAHALIVVTGGAVRLTGSGLGCPTWPQCVDGSYVPTAEMGIHGVIEFTNRTLTGVIGFIVGAALVLAWLTKRRELTVPALLSVLGVPAQAVVGGMTVLTNLNPWVVGCHFLASMAALVAAYTLWIRIDRPAGPPVWAVRPPVRALTWLTMVTSGAVIVAGTVVTGSGPHAGDADAKRNGLDPGAFAQLHTDLVFLLLGLSVALWLTLKAVGARSKVAGVFVLVLLGQGLIGFVQYFTHLPVVLVAAHMAGACVVWIATLAVWHDLRPRTALPVAAGQPRNVATV
ncbi:COX15/CtaA family protein [Longispora albida]|uniref:COX15/CtaA family protein n=1 Tax=Longispora albida TaxID=203523 RepID=UPI001FE0D6B7|nr:COX15/CtaA family protein [Longispora albida]